MIGASAARLYNKNDLSRLAGTATSKQSYYRWYRYTAGVVLLTISMLPSWAAAEACRGMDQELLPAPCTPSQRQATVQGSTTIAASTMQLGALRQVVETLGTARNHSDTINSESPRASSFALQLASLSFTGSSDSGSSVAFGRWNTFTNLKYGFGDHDQTENTPAHDFDTVSFLVGADYRLNRDLVVGFALGYLDSDNDFKSGSGEMELKSYSVSAFGSWYVLPAWYVDGIVRMGWNEYDMHRPLKNLWQPLKSIGTATGATDGTAFSASIGSGYEFNIGALTLGPRVRVDYINASIDGYTERGKDNLLAYDDQNIESLTANVGFEATYAINTGFGVVLPQANLEWVHEFKDDPDPINAVILASATNPERDFSILADQRDDSFFRGSLGATAILPGGKILYLLYETTFSRDNQDQHAITAGVRIEL